MDPAIEHDVEKQAETENLGAVSSQAFEYGDSPYAKLQRLAGKLKIEQRGIERVPDNERADSSYVNIGSMVCCYHSFRFQCLTFRSGWPQTWLSHPSPSVPWLSRSTTSVSWMRFSLSYSSTCSLRLLSASFPPSAQCSACDKWFSRGFGLDGGQSKSVSSSDPRPGPPVY